MSEKRYSCFSSGHTCVHFCFDACVYLSYQEILSLKERSFASKRCPSMLVHFGHLSRVDLPWYSPCFYSSPHACIHSTLCSDCHVLFFSQSCTNIEKSTLRWVPICREYSTIVGTFHASRHRMSTCIVRFALMATVFYLCQGSYS